MLRQNFNRGQGEHFFLGGDKISKENVSGGTDFSGGQYFLRQRDEAVLQFVRRSGDPAGTTLAKLEGS